MEKWNCYKIFNLLKKGRFLILNWRDEYRFPPKCRFAFVKAYADSRYEWPILKQANEN